MSHETIIAKTDKLLVLVGILILALIGSVFTLYWPALPGPFIFDDWHNLSPLGKYPELDSLQRVLIYITHEGESLIQRPISFLSFFINDNTWPSTPRGFRYTNIAIHSINTLLVFWLSLKLIALSNYKRSGTNTLFLAFTVALLWGLHPIQVNVVAFIVQRMTLLSGLFTLSGLILYSCGREQLATNNERKGLVLMSLSILIFLPLAFLSKETGVLLPLFIIVIECTLFRRLPGHKRTMRWSTCFVAIPVAIALVGIIVTAGENIIQAYDALPYDSTERLLTQSRILWDYLRSLLIPMARTSSLYHDNYLISSSLFNPITTIYSVLGWLLVFIIAVLIRSRWTIISFAVFWFLVGHLLESTVIGLEIYFEHRNYIPSFSVLFACVVGVNHVLHKKLKTLILLMVVYVSLLAFVTYMNTSKWSSRFELVSSWYQDDPSSIRTSKGVIDILISVGKYKEAREIVVAQQTRWPKNAEMPLLKLWLDCLNGSITQTSVTIFLRNLSSDFQHSNTLFQIITELNKTIKSNACPYFGLNDLERIIERLLEHPSVTDKDKSSKWGFFTVNLYYKLAIIGLDEGNLDKAISAIGKGNELWPTQHFMILEMDWLLAAGRSQEALDVAYKALVLSKERTIHDYLNPQHKKISEYILVLQQITAKKQVEKNKRENKVLLETVM